MSRSRKLHIGRVLSNRELAEGHYRMGIAAVVLAVPFAIQARNGDGLSTHHILLAVLL
jgi:hypothetical protein